MTALISNADHLGATICILVGFGWIVTYAICKAASKPAPEQPQTLKQHLGLPPDATFADFKPAEGRPYLAELQARNEAEKWDLSELATPTVADMEAFEADVRGER